MAIDDNTSYELTGAQVKDLANKIKAKAADNNFVGATSAAPGSKGLVPQPQAGDDTKFLKGDGTWGAVTGADIDWSGVPEIVGTYAADGDKNYALKYPDGTLVCCISKTLANRQFTSWGSIYGNDVPATSIGNFAVEFKYIPTCTVTCYSPGSTVIVGTQGGCTKTMAPGLTACRATSATLTLNIDVVAIGRWK